MPWTFDPTTRTYRDTDSGQTLREPQLRPIVRAFLDSALIRTREVTGELANSLVTIQEWEVEMRRIVKETYGAAYVLSRGGRDIMTQRDWGRLGQLSRRQYQYLNSYAADIASAGLTRDRALSRSELYIASARQAYQRGKLATYDDLPRLPRVPGDGGTACLVNCRCEIELNQTDAGDYEVYWLDLSDDRECRDCRQLATDWSPLELKRQSAQATTSAQEEAPT